jgi:hypothetical protein
MFDSNLVQNDFFYQTGGSIILDMLIPLWIASQLTITNEITIVFPFYLVVSLWPREAYGVLGMVYFTNLNKQKQKEVTTFHGR